MVSPVDICNRALGQSGSRSSITALNNPTPEARACALYYESTRDALLRAAHWDFARAPAYLSLLKALPGTPENTSQGSTTWLPEYPAPPWLYSYAYPSDAVAVRYITPQLYVGNNLAGGVPIFPVQGGTPYSYAPWRIDPQPFKVASDKDPQGNPCKAVLSNQTQAIAIYTKRIENPELWDSTFEEAMVDALAARLVFPLAGDKTLRNSLIASAKQSVALAQARDGNEGITYDEHVPDWIRVHGWLSPLAAGYVGQAIWPGFLST